MSPWERPRSDLRATQERPKSDPGATRAGIIVGTVPTQRTHEATQFALGAIFIPAPRSGHNHQHYPSGPPIRHSSLFSAAPEGGNAAALSGLQQHDLDYLDVAEKNSSTRLRHLLRALKQDSDSPGLRRAPSNMAKY